MPDRRGPSSLTPPRSVDQLDPAWLQAVLATGPVALLAADTIGTGQMSESHRLALGYEDRERAGPASVVLKLAASDPHSSDTGVGLGLHGREQRVSQDTPARS